MPTTLQYKRSLGLFQISQMLFTMYRLLKFVLCARNIFAEHEPDHTLKKNFSAGDMHFWHK